jgi:hypothetical protein
VCRSGIDYATARTAFGSIPSVFFAHGLVRKTRRNFHDSRIGYRKGHAGTRISRPAAQVGKGALPHFHEINSMPRVSWREQNSTRLVNVLQTAVRNKNATLVLRSHQSREPIRVKPLPVLRPCVHSFARTEFTARVQKKGTALRSSADENGCLLSENGDAAISTKAGRQREIARTKKCSRECRRVR